MLSWRKHQPAGTADIVVESVVERMGQITQPILYSVSYNVVNTRAICPFFDGDISIQTQLKSLQRCQNETYRLIVTIKTAFFENENTNKKCNQQQQRAETGE